MTLGPVFIFLLCLLLFDFILKTVSLLVVARWPPVVSNLHSSRLVITGHIELLSASVYLLTPGKAAIIPFSIICSNMSQPFWVKEESILVILGHKPNPFHLGTKWWTLSLGWNGGGEGVSQIDQRMEMERNALEWKISSYHDPLALLHQTTWAKDCEGTLKAQGYISKLLQKLRWTATKKNL